MKKYPVLFLSLCIILCGCGLGTTEDTRLRDLEFTVISEELLPEKLNTLLKERMTTPFKIMYNDSDHLYICIGYGQQKTGGYSIVVNDLYLTEDAIHINTKLLGPDAPGSPTPSYPYIVIKTEFIDKTLVFD